MNKICPPKCLDALKMTFRNLGVSEKTINIALQDVQNKKIVPEHILLFMEEIQHQKENKLLKVSEVARILNIGKKSAYRLIENKKIPYINVGDSIRIQHHDLINFIEKNKTPAK